MSSRLALAATCGASFLAVAPPAAAARFATCAGPDRFTCVVDGDTFWLDGVKIRVADINAPESTHPGCPSEAALARRATVRFAELLNAGAFVLAAGSRDEDRYGRKLRVVSRDGVSLGVVLVREGLAEPWHGKRGDWCATSAR